MWSFFPSLAGSNCPFCVHLWSKVQFEPAGLGKLIEKQFSNLFRILQKRSLDARCLYNKVQYFRYFCGSGRGPTEWRGLGVSSSKYFQFFFWKTVVGSIMNYGASDRSRFKSQKGGLNVI
jgi:hypothetical protein